MGLLDEAIREHLELKRRRGAEADEVARLEREALGPVVRGDELAPSAELADAEAPSPEHLATAHDTALEPPEPAIAGPEETAALEPRPEPVEHYEPPPHAGQPTEEFDVEATQIHEPPPAERPPSQAAPAPPAPPAPAPEAQPGEHDVLEDTPDFLQETPEHDRLWFEQAPPQEFDFDK